MDYKDQASAAYRRLVDRAVSAARGLPYGQKRAITVALRRVPDGDAAPRAFAAWVSTAPAVLKPYL